VYGSQQDNTAISLPSMSMDGSITEKAWYAPGGGESGYIAVKHDDPNIVVGSGPQNRRVFNHYMTAYDHRTRQTRDVTVWPELYGWGEGAESLKYRFQWTFPIVFSRHRTNVLYACSNHVHRSTDVGGSWEVISPDLTRNDPSRLRPSGGPVTRDNTGAEVYCTIFSLAESLIDPAVLWAGSDDGLVHVSRDGGTTWQNVTPAADLLPDWALISIIEPSPHDATSAYVAATRYKLDDTAPYLLRTNDYGATWTLITEGIPTHEFTRVIREDPSRRGLLYAGTETGLFVSFDDGRHWDPLRGNLPVVPVYDLTIKGVEMVVASHGRSFWILDDLTPLHQMSDALIDAAHHLFQPRAAVRLRTPARRFPDDPKVDLVNYERADTTVVSYFPVNGEHRYLDAGDNPPAGVVIQYYLREQPEGPITLDVLSGDGQTTLRSFSPEARPGLNRFVWNMRLAGEPRIGDKSLDAWQRDDGPMVLSGTYQVRLTVEGHSQSKPLEIVPDPRIAASTGDLQSQFDMLMTIAGKIGAVNRQINRVGTLQEQLAAWLSWTADHPQRKVLDEAAEPLQVVLESLKTVLIDVHYPEAQLHAVGLQEKLNALFEFVDSADYAPPRQAHDVLAELSARFDAAQERFDREVQTRVTAVNEALQAVGMTPLVEK
jgi:hypothetical protein